MILVPMEGFLADISLRYLYTYYKFLRNSREYILAPVCTHIPHVGGRRSTNFKLTHRICLKLNNNLTLRAVDL